MALSVPQIKKALKNRGWSYERIGQELADPPLSYSTIIKNVKKVPGNRSSRARKAIADALGMSVEDVYGAAA